MAVVEDFAYHVTVAATRWWTGIGLAALLLCLGMFAARAEERSQRVVLDPKLPFTIDELAGEYSLSYGLGGTVLRVMPNGTLATGHWGDVITPGIDPIRITRAGTWTMKGDVMLLKHDEGERSMYPLPTKLVPIKWGRYMYLSSEIGVGWLIENRKKEFNPYSDDIGLEYRKRIKLILTAAEKAAPPSLPARYQTLYDKGPIIVQIKTVHADGTVTLNSGSSARLWQGMLLVPGYKPGTTLQDTWRAEEVERQREFAVRVTSVESGSARGEVIRPTGRNWVLKPGEYLASGNAFSLWSPGRWNWD